MKYGTNQEGLALKCANCGKTVSKTGILEKNYCPNCGAPLSILAIAEYSESARAINKEFLTMLTDISSKNKTDSFSKILEIYNRM